MISKLDVIFNYLFVISEPDFDESKSTFYATCNYPLIS